MVFHAAAHYGGLELLAATGKLGPAVLAFLGEKLLPAVVLYNMTVNIPNVLRQSCLVVRGVGVAWRGVLAAEAAQCSVGPIRSTR